MTSPATVKPLPATSPSMWRLVAAAAFAALGVLAYGASGYRSEDLDVLLLLIALGAVAERYAIGLFNSHVSVGMVAVLVAAIIGGAWGVALVAPAIIIAGEFRTASLWYKRVYNASVYVLSGGAFAGIFAAFGQHATPDDWPAVLIPALLGAAANFAVNSGLIAAVVGIASERPFIRVWRENYEWLLPQYMIIGLAAMSAATAYEVMGFWGLAVFAAPIAGIRHAYYYGARPPREAPATPAKRAA